MPEGDDWAAGWQRLQQEVGREFDERPVTFSADRVEAGAIRRYLEPLEFDCPLHYDRDVAIAHGYAHIVVPTSALPTFAMAPMWRPGEVLFGSDDRDAQPTSTPITGILTGLEPATSGYCATNYDVEYFDSAVVGDRLARHGAKLVACEPKETKVGRGAFLTWQSQIVNERLDVVARLQTTFFRYKPR